MRSFLSTYIGNSVINGSNYYNASLNGSSYVLVQVNASSFSRFAIVNVTSGRYSFVTSNSTAFSVLDPFMVSRFYPSNSTLANLSTEIKSFHLKSFPPLNQCVLQTGLNFYTCTSSTPLLTCLQRTCQHVLICGGTQTNPKSMLTQSGIPSPFASGVLNFSIDYNILNNSYNRYLSLLSSINTGNYTSNISGMVAALANISSISTVILENPVFPAPSNITLSTISSVCPQYASQLNGPWWCYANGYCSGTTFNYTLLGQVDGQLSTLQSLPVSYSAVSSISANSTALVNSYLFKQTAMQETVQFNAFIASILPSYNSTVANVTSLVNHIKNATLSTELQQLVSVFATIRGKGINQNMTVAEKLLSGDIANVSSTYRTFSRLYGGAFSIASNNTYSILVKELSFRNTPLSLSTLAARQEQINALLSQGVNTSEAASLQANLNSIKGSLSLIINPLYGASLVKGFDGGFITSMLSGSTEPIPAKLAGGIGDATVLSLVIAVALFLLFYMFVYRRLKARHKLKLSHRTMRAWRMLFIAIFVIAIIYVSLTYVYASNATRFLPFDSFVGALKSSANVYMVYNSTANSSVISCINSAKATLQNLGKNAVTVELKNYSCAASSDSSLAGTSCLDKIIGSGQPVVIISPGANSSMVYKGLYGRVLYAAGAAASGPSCLLNSALTYK